jgi:hypothetical protein
MISRILVPIDARPPAAVDAPTQRRRPTTMDTRTLVPAMLPIVSLNGQSSIPTNLPLESIAARVVVPRDLNSEAYGVKEDLATPLQPTDMDERITVPQGAAPLDMNEPMLSVPTDLVDPDIFITGEVHLAAPEPREDKTKWQVITRFSSVAFHVLLLTAILLQSKLFPPHEPTQQDIDLARRMLTWIPPESSYSVQPRAQPRPAQPSPKMHVDPRVLRQIAPTYEPAPAPQPERPVKELPNAPVPKPNDVQPEPQPAAPVAKMDMPKPALKLEAPDTPQPQAKLQFPKDRSPSQSMQDILKGSRPSGPRAIGGGGQLPGGGSRGGGGGTAYGGIEMLTPDEGVDFNDYLHRVYVTVKRNWFSVMPGSVELGEKGIVYLTFRINRDGSVPSDEPVIERNSGKEPLDRAAYSSVRASNPFEPLPPQFKGPYIELRYRYYYNIRPNDFNQQ